MKKLLCFFIGTFLLIGSASSQCITVSPSTISAVADGQLHHYYVTFPNAGLDNMGRYALEYQFYYEGEPIPEDSLGLFINKDTAHIATKFMANSFTGAYIENSHGFFPSEPFSLFINLSTNEFNFFFGRYLKQTQEQIRFSIEWLRSGDYTIGIKLWEMTGGEQNYSMNFNGSIPIGGYNATPSAVLLSTAFVTTKVLSDTTVYICHDELPYTQGNCTWTLDGAGWGTADANGVRFWTQAVQFITQDPPCNINRLDSTQTINVGLYPAITASVNAQGNNTTICSQTTAGYAILTVGGGKAPYSIQPVKDGQNYGDPIEVAQAGNNIKVGGLSAGNYTFVVTDANECSVTTSSINIATAQTDNTITVNTNISHVTCYGGNNGRITTTLSITGTEATPYTYQWSNDSTGTSVSQLTAGEYTVTVTDNMGCIGTATVTVSEAPAITNEVEVTCCNYQLPYHFDEQHANTIFTEAGTKQVKYTASNGCDSVVSVTLTVVTPSVTLSDISGDGTICKGGSTTLTVSPIADGTNGTLSYVWSAGGHAIENSNNASITVSPSDTTLYTVVATATIGEGNDACTATDTTSFTVNVNAPAVVLNEISGTSTICNGGETELSISTTTGTKGNVTYVWNTQETTSAITVEPTSTTEYSVVATATVGEGNEACSVSASKSVEVTVNAPAVTLSNIQATRTTICREPNGNGTTLSVEPVSNTGNVTYSWSNNRTEDTWNTASITVNPSDTTLYTVVATATVSTNNVTCTVTDSKSVTVNVNAPAVVLNAITPATICQGGSTTLEVSAASHTGELSYVWNEGNTAIANSNSASLEVNPNTTTTYSVVATATVGEGNEACTATDTKSVTVTVNAPAVALNNIDPVTICKGGQGTTLTVAANDGTNGTLSYVWSAGGQAIENSNSASISVNPEATTTYTVVVTATVNTNDVVCTATASKSVTVNVNAPAVTISDITGSSTICAGSNTILSVVPTSNNGTVSYAWTAGNETVGGNNNSITVTPDATTEYTVVATATVNTNDVTCTATDTKSFEVTVNAPAVALGDIAGTTTICKGNETTLSVEPTSSTGTVTYAWSNQEDGNSITVSPTQNTTYIVTATATVNTNNVSCTATDTKSVVVTVNAPALTMAAISGDTHFCLGGSTQLTASTQTANGDVTYAWSPADYLNATTGATVTSTPTAEAEGEITYTVVGTATVNTNDVTCTATATQSVTVTVNDTVQLSTEDATLLTQSVCAGSHITPVEISYANATVTHSTIPAGMTYSDEGNTITLAGAPTTAGEYTITLTAASNQQNPICSGKTLTFNLNVNPTVTLSATHLTQRVCAGSDITDVEITNSNSTVTTSELPAGLQFDPEDYIITGAPTTAGTYEVIITATSDQSNPQCAAKKDTLKLTVDPAVELSAVAENLNQTVCAGEGNGINPVAITYDNATLSFSYTKDNNDESQNGLPAGLEFSNGAIAGIPTTAGSYVITITATSNLTNPVCGPRSITFYLTVNPVITLNVTNRNQTVCAGTAINNVVITNTNSTVTTSELPAGLTFSNNTISGTPTTAEYYEIVIIASNAETGCLEKKDTFKLTVNPTVVLEADDEALTQTICAGSSITPVELELENANTPTFTYTKDGGNSTEGLPAGLNFDQEDEAITGAPTTAGTYAITITATSDQQNPTCDPETVTFNLTVNPTVTLSATNLTQSVCAGSAITNVVITNTNSTVTTSELPAGLTFSNNTISGTPTTAGTYAITITATSNQEPACTAETVTFNLTVKALPEPTLSNAVICASTSDINNTLTLTTDAGMSNYTWSVDGGTITEGTGTNTIKVQWAAAGEKNISVTYTGTNGCEGTNESSVTVYAAPEFTVTGNPANNSICAVEGTDVITVITVNSNTQYNYEWSAATGLDMEDAEASNAKEFKSNTAGTYAVTIIGSETHDNLTCQTTQNVTVTVNAQPVLTVTPQNPTCYGGNNGKITTTVTGGTPAYTFDWSNDTHSNNAQNLTAGTYSVTVTDGNGCHAYATDITLTDPSQITATKSNHVDVDCHGASTGAFTVTASNGTAFDGGQYLYKLGDDQEGTLAVSKTFNNLPAGNYVVTVSDRNGCPVEIKDTIREPEELTAGTISGPESTLCYNTGTMLTGATEAAGGNGTITYKWQILNDNTWTDIDNATNGASYNTGNLTATTQYRRAATNQCGTVYTEAVTVEVYPDVTAGTITVPEEPICYNTNTTLNATVATNGNGTIEYQWQSKSGNSDWANIENANDQNYITGNLTATTTFRRVDASCGRSANTNEVTVTVYPDVTAGTITAVDPICYNTNATLSASVATGGNSSYTYQWQSKSGNNDWANIENANDQNYTANNLTVTTSFRRVDASCGITKETEPVTVTVYPELTAGAINAPAATICYNSSTTLEATVAAGGNGTITYQWQVLNGENWSNLEDNYAANQNYTTGNLTTTTKYRRAATNSCGTVYTNEVTVNVYPALTASDITGGTTGICIGETRDLSVTVTSGSGDYTYAWKMASREDSELWGDATGSNNAATYAAPINEAGTTYYKVTITDNCGNHQLTKGPVQVTVWEELDVEDLTDQTVCKDAVVTLTATATGGNGQYTYAWYKDNELISGATTYQYTPSTATAGSSSIYKVEVTDNCVNSVEKPATIAVYSMPVVSAGEDVTICVGTETELTASAENGKTPYTYQWFKGNTSLTDNTANDITYTTPVADATAGASTTYKVVVTDACGNTANDEVVVSVNAALALTKSDSTDIICHGQSTGSITVAAANGAPNYQYKVDNGSYGEATDETIATFSELAAGSHTVTVKDNCGTEASVTFVLREPEELALAVTAHSDLTCNGNNTGSITVTASNGTANYQYKIDNENYGDATAETTATFSGLAAGAHTITVMDNCSVEKTAPYTLTEPAVLTLTESADDHQDVSCYNGTNGSVTVNVTGGTSTYQYKVGINGSYGNATTETSFTYANRPAEKDTLYVKDANGCEASIPVEITQPEELTLTENETLHKDITCNGDNNGEITVIAAGGFGPTYLYNWNNGGYGGNSAKDQLTAGNYTIVVKDGHQCTASVTVTITEPDELTATIEGTNISCYGETDGTITVSVSGGTEPYTYRWNDDTPQNRVAERTNLAAGEYTVTVTDDHYCTSVKNITLTQPDNFTVTVSGDAEICADETTTFTATTTGDVTLKWYLNDNEIANQTSATLSNINTAGTYKVVATQTGSNCTKEATITLTVDTLPNVTITGESSICYNTQVTLTANNADSYVWGEDMGTEPSVTHTLIADRTYNVTGTNSYGCTASASHTVTVNALPSATMTFTLNNETVTPDNSQIKFCAGGNLALSVPAAEGSTYTWFGADEQLAENGHSLTLTNATPEQTGWYYVKITDANGCNNQSASTLIVANPLPNVVLSEDHNLNTICADSAFHFTVTCAACTTDVSSYVWKYNDVIIDGASTSTLRATEGGTYVVTATDENGCVKTTNALPVTVNALPTVTLASTPAAIDGIALICDGQTATLTATSETNSFSWEKDRESIEGSGNTLEVTEEGKYTVSVTDNNGCSNTSDTITVYVNPLPDFIFGVVVGEIGSQENETNVCRGTEVTLIAAQMQDAETYTYTWSTSDYLSTTDNTRTFSNEAPAGTYTISVTATSEFTGCSQTLSRTIIVHELPTIVVANAQVCLNGTVALSASGADEYEWTPASYFMAPNTITDVVTGANVTFYGTEAGEKEITITGTDEYGCVNETTATVTVLNLPTTGLTLANKEICQGASTSWTIENGNYTNYVWASSSEDALTADGATATFTSSTTGTHSVTVTVTDNNNCTNSSSAEVMVHALPTPTLSSDNAVCEGNTITFTTDIANADNGIHDYIWTYPETNATVEGETTGNTLTLSWSDNGTKTVTVNYTDGNGCTATQAASRSITVNALPDVVITNGQSAAICLGGTVNLNAVGATSYVWENEAGNTATITVEPKRDSTFTVTGTDDNGCSNTASINITVYDTVKLAATNTTQAKCLGDEIDEIVIESANCTLDFGQMSQELAYDAENHKITGRLTSAGVHSFTITATSEHGCSSKSVPVFITMNDTVKLAATNTTQTHCLGTAIEPIVLDTAHCTLNFGEMPDELSYNETSHQIEGRLTEAGTYNFTVTATNGCNTKTKDVSITVNDTVKLTVTHATQELCLGTPITLIGIVASNGEVSIVGLPTGLSDNSDHIAITGELTTAGTHTFTITASNNCGNKTADVSITMLDTAKLTATNTTQTLCLGTPIQPIVLDTAHCTLDFDEMPDGLSYNATTHQIEGQLTEADEYEFTITATTNGCGTKTQDVSITVNDTVSLTVTPATQTLCLGTPITTIEIEAENGTVSFVGLPTGLSANSDNSAITGELTTAGTHTFTIKATSTSCSSSDKQQTVSITMNDTVELVAISPADNFNQKFCKGEEMTALNFRITNSDNVELTGAPAGVTLAAVEAESETEPNYVMSGTPTATGTFNFTITASSEACEASVKTFNGTIIVDTIPAVAITTDATNNTVCAGETITLTATAGYEEYTWNNESEDDVVEEIPDRPHYEVTVTNGEGCSNTATINITINALPTVTISEEHGLSTICADSVFHFTATCQSEEPTYAWKFNNTLIEEAEESTLRATEAGKYVVNVTDENGCSNVSDTLTVTVHTLPVVTTDVVNVSCTERGAVTLIITGEGTSFTCAWNGANPVAVEQTADGFIKAFSNLNGGDYIYAITDNNGCTTNDTVTVGDPGTITGTQSILSDIAQAGICKGSDNIVTFSIDGGTPDYTIEWVDVNDGEVVAETDEVSSTPATFNLNELAAGDYLLAMVITDVFGCTGIAADTIALTVWPTYEIVREINIATGITEYTYNGETYNVGETPATENLHTIHGCDSIITYEVHQYDLTILIADNCVMTRSSYTAAYANTPDNLLGDTIYVAKNDAALFYAYLQNTSATTWNDKKMDMSYELLYNEQPIADEDLSSVVSRFRISTYYDRAGLYYGRDSLTSATGEIPSNTLAFRQTASSTILQFDYFYFDAFKNIPNMVSFTALENGTYTLKLKAELRNSTGGTNRAGIYNPFIVNRRYGHLWGGFGDVPGDKEIIAARTFTIIVNEDGAAPQTATTAPNAISEYSNNASVSTYPNPVNDQLNLVVKGMEGNTQITITDAQGKVVRVINAELTGSDEVLTYNVSDFAQGVYFLNVRNNEKVISQKFVVTQR